MKNRLLQFTFLLALLLFTACGSRVPFIEKQVSEDLALVYIYVSNDMGTNDSIVDSPFTIRINNKNIDNKIRMNEYLSFYMKANKTEVTIVRDSIEKQALEIDLDAGNTYYLRVDSNLDSNRFLFTQIDSKIASQEIKKTGLAGSKAVDENNIITEVVDSMQNNNLSKSDEIKKAYKLKVDGLITQKEYQKLKTEILSK